jgi:hypothetical protein
VHLRMLSLRETIIKLFIFNNLQVVWKEDGLILSGVD